MHIVFYIGTVDYSKPYSSSIWARARARAMLVESEDPEPFYTDNFKEWADENIQQEFGFTQEAITFTNCIDVYMYLVSI